MKLEAQLTGAANRLIRDHGKPIRAFSLAVINGHPIWLAVYHDFSSDCHTFESEGNAKVGNTLECFARLWGARLEYPDPDFEKVKIKGEELNLNGTKVNTSIRVLDGSGYFIALRFPDEVPSWKARQIVNELGPSLIRQAAEAYNKNPKRK